MKTKACSVCSKQYYGRENSVTCSHICREERFKKKFGRYSDKSIPSGTVGAMSELAVSMDLMKKGYSVFRALSPACFCDVIAVKGEQVLKIEIRTGYIAYNGKLSYPDNVRGTVDTFGIYERNKNECFYFNLKREPIIL